MAGFISDRSYDYGDFGEDSDDERAESSEDEIDILLHGTPEQRRRLHHHHQRQQLQTTDTKRSTQHRNVQKNASSSEDEFEREMNAELDKTVHVLEQARGKKQKVPDKTSSTATAETQNNSHSGVPVTASTSESSKFYDDVYFDSDDENNFEGEEDARVQRHHMQPSNDDLLYDPDMDDEDQRWVDRQRQRQHGQRGDSLAGDGDMRRMGGKRKGATSTDAVLDCPACMTTLCIDCQRHDIYPHQFRAMFVMNCRVDTTELLRVPEQAPKKKAKKSKKPATPSGDGGGASGSGGVAGEGVEDRKDKFHPVKCDECDTVVGVIDMDEVYHFFNVLTSLP